MKFPAFSYAVPATVAEALELLAADEDARPLAGGQTLLPILALRMASPGCLVDLSPLSELKNIVFEDQTLKIGAMVTFAQLARATAHQANFPLIYLALKHVAHVAIRNRGTIGGSLAYADAAAEMPVVVCALNAIMVIAGVGGARRVAAADFFTGHFSTAIERRELLTQIEFPISDHTWAFEEVSRRPGDFALVMAATGLRMRDGQCAEARIALGCVADRPLRAPAAEAFLSGKQITEETAAEAGQIATSDLKSHADIHASAEYRRKVGSTLIKRALLRAAVEPRL
ncbi:MAG: xanthine dehydrogenase family protein subunit M [Proteobacteria bacterium]|nr:xanthine dehydrogenase family protein subunit M [Pseudomonadota bacterium]